MLVGKLSGVFRLVVVSAGVAVVAGGCAATADRSAAAADTAVRMLRAVAERDGGAACGLLAPDTATELEEGRGRPCAQAILEEDLPEPGVVTERQVYGQWAQVRVGGDTLFLAVFPQGWRVVAAGCAPGGGGPYDCAIRGG